MYRGLWRDCESFAECKTFRTQSPPRPRLVRGRHPPSPCPSSSSFSFFFYHYYFFFFFLLFFGRGEGSRAGDGWNGRVLSKYERRSDRAGDGKWRLYARLEVLFKLQYTFFYCIHIVFVKVITEESFPSICRRTDDSEPFFGLQRSRVRLFTDSYSRRW